LAVNGVAAAPLLLVVTETVVVLFENVPLAPVPGAVNVTDTPLTALFEASVTDTFSAVANAVLIVALCGVPAVAATLAAGPALLVNWKFAGPIAPTFAVTV
jgi:hypothetical protein